MDDKKPFILINIEDKVVPATLGALLNRNVSLLYQWAQTGRLPNFKDHPFSYRECIDHLTSHLLRAEEAKIVKAQEDARLKEIALEKKAASKRSFSTDGFGGVDDSMHPLMAAKLKQNIKTEIAREADLWQKIAIKRGEYVSFADKLELVEGAVTAIRDTLLHIGNNYPDIQSRVDEAMGELYQLGCILCEEADVDAGNYIQAMLDKEPELDYEV